MDADNLLLVAVCGPAVVLAAVIAWRGRTLPLIGDHEEPDRPATAALDGVRTIVSVAGAAAAAGTLVVGLGGRLLMRVLAATSDERVQGLSTDAQETVGEITLAGSLGFVFFVGIMVPVVTSAGYLFVRRFLPPMAGPAGMVVGLLLLGSIGISDPLSPDNSDFDLLEPTVLAVGLVALTALLYGVTFTAIAARLDARCPPPNRLRAPGPVGPKLAYLVLPMFLVPPMAAGATAYVAIRAVVHGRSRPLLAAAGTRIVGSSAVGLATVSATVATVGAVMTIVS
jgi:hypothetical protein